MSEVQAKTVGKLDGEATWGDSFCPDEGVLCSLEQ